MAAAVTGLVVFIVAVIKVKEVVSRSINSSKKIPVENALSNIPQETVVAAPSHFDNNTERFGISYIADDMDIYSEINDL